MADLGTATGRIVIDASGARAGVASASQSLLGFGKSALKTAGIIGGAAGLYAAIKDTVSAAAQFEQQMSALEAVSNASSKTMAKLSAQALRLGQSTQFSASEVASAQTELVKAGSTTEDVLGGALDAALALAAAGEVDLAQAATTVATALNAFGLSAGDAGRVADVLAVTANTTATDIGELSMAMQQGASAAKQAGLPFEDFIGMLGALAEEGVRGSDAGTSLKAALLGIIAPVGRGEKAIAKYGLEFFKSNGQIKSAVGIAQELREKLGQLNPQQRTAALNAIAGRDGFRALAAAYDMGAAALGRNITASQRQGAAAEAARIKQDNLRGDVEKLGGAIETLQIKAAGAVTGGLRVLTQGATDLIDAATKSEDLAAFGQALLQLGAASAGAVGSLAPLGSALGSIASVVAGIAGPVLSFGASLLAAAAQANILSAAIVGLGAAFATMKLGAVATGVAQFAGSVSQFGLRAASATAASQALAGRLGILGRLAPLLSNPYVAAAAAVGGLAAGITLLATGTFQGASHAEAMAASLNAITAAASGATGAVHGLAGAVNSVKDANLRATTTALAVERATKNLAVAQDTYGRSSLEAREAQAQLAQAQFNANQAIAGQARANQGLTASAAGAITKTAELITQTRRGTLTAAGASRIARQLGLSQEEAASAGKRLAKDLGDVDRAGGGLSGRMNALRTFVRRAGDSLDLTTKSGRQTKEQLDKLGKLDTAGISRFGTAFNQALAEGKRPAVALKEALASIKPPKKMKLDAEDAATAKIKKAAQAALKMKDKKVKVDADTSGAEAGISSVQSMLGGLRDKTVTITTVHKDKKGSWNVQETIEAIERTGDKTVTFTTIPKLSGKLQKQLSPQDVVSQREALSAKLATIEAKEDARQDAAERKRMAKAVSNAQAALRKAKPEDRGEAKRTLADAQAALAEFRKVSAFEAKQATLQSAVAAREGIIEGIRSGGDAVRSTAQDLGSRLGEAIDRGLQAKIAGLGDTLKATLDEIAASPEAQRIKDLDVGISARRDARSARDAAKQGTDLAKAQGDAAAIVARRRESLAKARTESERQAAQALLDQALADEAAAAQATADFREDQELTALEREKANLETSLQQRRDAAQQAHDDAVAAAQAEADAHKAGIERQLGDAAEAFAQGLINRKQYNKRLAAIVGDPALAADLERSGRELGLSFTRGLSRAIGSAEDAAEGLARAIAKYLKLKSPAETGPLAHDFRKSGATLVTDFAAGMSREAAALTRATAGLASTVALRASGAPAAAAPAAGVVNQTTINVDGPTLHPRTLAAQLAWEAQAAGEALVALEYDLVLHDDGTPLTLEGAPVDPESCYLLQDVQGLDGRDIREEVLDLPDRDGDYLGSVRQAGLVLVLAGKIVGVDRADLRAKERALRGALVPTAATWRLRVAGRVGDPEDLVAEVRPSAPFRSADSFDHSRRVKDWQVALRAGDAVLYGAAEQVVTTYPVTGAGGLTFPLDFDLDLGGAEDLGETALNAGDAEAWPVLRVYGPITNPRIENLTTGGLTLLVGSIAESSYVELDARAASPVKLNGITSAYSMLDRANSALWPLLPGPNQVRVRAAVYSGSARLEVRWRNAYL